MEAFLSRKRPRRLSPARELSEPPSDSLTAVPGDDESTELKLATLASLYPYLGQAILLDCLITADGSIAAACELLDPSARRASPRRKTPSAVGHQTSLAVFRTLNGGSLGLPPKQRKLLTRKGRTLHLYSPEDIAEHTPCSIVHNFLPKTEADALLKELLQVATTFERQTFKLFDNVVQSPHSACFFVDSLEEQKRQRTEYLYNGSYLTVWIRMDGFFEV